MSLIKNYPRREQYDTPLLIDSKRMKTETKRTVKIKLIKRFSAI
ncbi:hypothetical protein HMPREF6123_0877 [Oribacterium sinus F0268]|uniref:Uncharacterized protein n=1 Tax=Oribacterium sinus F0268 TaxID=585501 RepID=C2KWK8_9FIRM|nr:hypothetical protein HMPREF6123_0877 [Oribacterium sinus F0268]